MFTDAWYFFAAYDFISKHLPNTGNGNNIYQYHYTHQGDNALSVELGYGGPYGVGHCDETFLQFHPYMNKKFQLSHIDSLQSNMLVTSWKNFVKFGDPSTSTVKWDPIKSLDDRRYLNIKLSSVMEYSSDVDKRMKLWDGLINPNQINSGNVFRGIFGIYSLYYFIMLYFFFI
jgi:carboxylesterase type B